VTEFLPGVRDAKARCNAVKPVQGVVGGPTRPETVALARELKRRGFRFVGPTTLYALMQACGLVDDRLASCPVRPAVERAR
jgi:3-methyladenine DNA glycosylase Tag